LVWKSDVRHSQPPSMPSLTTLPLDLWFAIVEYLSPCDLCTFCETFVGPVIHADVQTISRRQANKVLHSIFITAPMMVQFYVKSNGKCLPPPHRQRRRFFPFSHPPAKADRSFASISLSKIKLNISTNKSEKSIRAYHPILYGEEPVEICSVEVAFYPYSYPPSSKDDQFLLLVFNNRDPPNCHRVNVEYHHTMFLTRTITQNLHLERAYWMNKGEPRERELPTSYFSFLGNDIRATTIFTKGSPSINPPLSPPEEWIGFSSFFRSASISFDDFALPAFKSLLHMLPPEVIPQESTEQG
jgi:hypothetical protein